VFVVVILTNKISPKHGISANEGGMPGMTCYAFFLGAAERPVLSVEIKKQGQINDVLLLHLASLS
jgi:hypothetical protein